MNIKGKNLIFNPETMDLSEDQSWKLEIYKKCKSMNDWYKKKTQEWLDESVLEWLMEKPKIKYERD